jgi:hypothetical protein
VQKSLILAVILSLLAGTARAACPSNPADCPATTASTVTTPNLNATGAVTMSGISAGTQSVCLGLDPSKRVVSAACSTGGSGGGLTVGSSTITGGVNGRLLYDANGLLGEYATLPVAFGGTGSASPSLVAGANVSITGSWPNQTINASGVGGGSPGGSVGQIQYNNSGSFGGLTNTQLTADINVFTAGLSGAAPASGGGSSNYLRADGTWNAPPTGSTTFANPSGLAGPVAVNGVATTAIRSDATPAIQLGSSSQKGIIQVDNQTIVATSGVISTVAPLRKASSPTVGITDMGGTLIIISGGVAIPVISAGLFDNKQTLFIVNYGGSAASVTNNSGQSINVGGGCALSIPAGGSWQLQANGSSIDCAQFVSAATGGGGGTANTIASSTANLGTSSIASGICATAVQSAGSGIATTDVITWGFNGDPTGANGYIPTTNGMLTIIAYPTTNNANFKVCNNTTASITPGAITLNWRVIR